HCYAHHRHPHTVPTRRSSDLQAGQLLLQFLEQRADNVIYRAGFTISRPAARQLVTHGHFELNGRRVDIPSIRLKVGDKLTLRKKDRKSTRLNSSHVKISYAVF